MWGEHSWIVVIVVGVVWALILAFVDLRYQRLPDMLTLPAALIAMGGAAIIDPALILGGLGWAALYLATGIAVGGVGGGDIKLSLSLGTIAAVGGPMMWLLTILTSSVLTAMAAGVRRQASFPHGPSMLMSTATWLVVGFTL